MDDYCCDECSYWEDRADINTENEIKMRPRKIEGDIIIAIPKLNTKPVSGTHKTNRGLGVERKRGIIKAIIRKSRGWLNLPR